MGRQAGNPARLEAIPSQGIAEGANGTSYFWRKLLLYRAGMGLAPTSAKHFSPSVLLAKIVLSAQALGRLVGRHEPGER